MLTKSIAEYVIRRLVENLPEPPLPGIVKMRHGQFAGKSVNPS
jgi:hypothetical protein